MKKLILTLLLITLNLLSFSQTDKVSFCSHNESVYKELNANPALKHIIDSIQSVQSQFENNYKNSISRSGTIYYIPIVFHVIHQGGAENISDAQIQSTLVELNNLYRKRNSNVNNVDTAFLPIVADIEIEFRLAQKKEDGTCFSGITRTFSSSTNGGGVPAMNAVISTHGNFPGNKYLNVFISKNIGGAAGYTYYPGYPYNTGMKNGIHILHTYVGKIGTSTQTGVNTTLAHEVGHWLNLPHLWGSSNSPAQPSNCSIDDGVSDTPLTIGWRYCSIGGITCGTRDNVENVMEYSYCSKMFTLGQKTRMRAALNSSIGGRNNLITTSNHFSTGIFSNIICEADFYSKNKINCKDDTIQFFDNSFHNPTSWSWSFPGGSPNVSTAQNPRIVYSTPGKYSITLLVSNASGSITRIKSQYLKILPSIGKQLPFHESFEVNLAVNDWETNVTLGSANWLITSPTSTLGYKSLKLNNFTNQAGTLSELLSTSIDLSGSSTATISYKYAYTRTSSTQGEIIQLLISSDCGENWVVVRGLLPTTSIDDSDFTPVNTGQWKTHSYNLNPLYFNSNFRFKFKVKNGNGNNLYLDEININRNVGISEFNKNNLIHVYPNPMLKETNVSLDLRNNSKISVSILNVLGETVKEYFNEKQMNSGKQILNIKRDNLKPGIYFLRIKVGKTVKLEKITVK